MFQGWNFLIGEIWVLLLLAGLIGLFVGWIIWGHNSGSDSSHLQNELDACRAKHAEKDTYIAELEARQSNQDTVTAPASVIDVPTEGIKPATLASARNNTPDDLKRIKGVGPKLETLCHSLGFYHYDQIAAWTAAEVAWVDENLTGFKGRVSRDEWVKQAVALAAEHSTDA